MILLRVLYFIFLSLISIVSCEELETIELSEEEPYTIIKEIKLPDELEESSGIIFIDSLVLSFNDSGNDAILYALDTATARIKYQWEITNVKNKDWEDISQDENYIYVGDFGNNLGSRKDLAIFKIDKGSLFQTDNIEAEIINFSFEDQTDFIPSYYRHSFDCEAMICWEDSIYVFSKDWKDLKTTSYVLPKEPGTYVAKKRQVFNTRGLVTGADYNEKTNTLVFTGYQNYEPFIWMFSNFSGADFFSSTYRKINLEQISNIQNEGVCFYNDSTILMSSENKNLPARLFQIEINN